MPELDPAKKDAFAGKMVGVLNGAMLALMISLGRQTGLLETRRICLGVDHILTYEPGGRLRHTTL